PARRGRDAALVQLRGRGRPGRARLRVDGAAAGVGALLGDLRVERLFEKLSEDCYRRLLRTPLGRGDRGAPAHAAAREGSLRAALRVEQPARHGRHPAAGPAGAGGAGVLITSPLTDYDLHLFNEGSHTKLYEKLGAHLNGKGAHFAVWAPDA